MNKIIFIILFLIFVSIIYYFFIYHAEEKSPDFYIEKCKKIMSEKDANYTICCLEGDFDCTNREKFKVNENVVVVANLRKLNKYFDPYYTCSWSNINESQNISDISNLLLWDSYYKCTREIYRKDNNYLYQFGSIPDIQNKENKILLLAIWAFPTGNYKTLQDFENSNSSKYILEVMGEVE